MRRKIVAIVGDALIDPNGLKAKMAFEAAKALVDNGYRVQSGGLRGVMEAAFKGAHASANYKEGDTIAILPSFNVSDANDYADIVIPTGLDLYRNVIVAGASAVVAIGGGAGTLTEIGNAWALKRLIVSFNNVDGWSAKIADTKMDGRVRYTDIPEDKVYGVDNAEDMIKIINANIDRYDMNYVGIRATDKP